MPVGQAMKDTTFFQGAATMKRPEHQLLLNDLILRYGNVTPSYSHSHNHNRSYSHSDDNHSVPVP